MVNNILTADEARIIIKNSILKEINYLNHNVSKKFIESAIINKIKPLLIENSEKKRLIYSCEGISIYKYYFKRSYTVAYKNDEFLVDQDTSKLLVREKIKVSLSSSPNKLLVEKLTLWRMCKEAYFYYLGGVLLLIGSLFFIVTHFEFFVRQFLKVLLRAIIAFIMALF